jgi:CRISPR-associated protein Csx3
LFNSYSTQELEKLYFEQAPTELAINLHDALQTIAPSSNRWEFEMLGPLLASLPEQTPLSVYGVGPNWLYAALAAHVGQQPFYQFDPRLQFGWIQPLRVHISTTTFPEVIVTTRTYQDMNVLSIEIPSQHLEYFQLESLPFPPVQIDAGLIIDGKIPLWLLTALVRLYQEAGVAWIAAYYVQSKKAVVVYSRVEVYNPGDLIPMPSS